MSLEKTLKQLAKLISRGKKEIVGSLFSKGTGRLKSSIKESVVGNEDKGYQIRSQMVDYGYYQDSGVSGTKRKVRANAQSINPPGKFSGKFKMIGGNLSFGARTNIYKKGLKPKPFVKPSVLTVMNDVGYDMIADASAEDVALQFTNTFKGAKIG